MDYSLPAKEREQLQEFMKLRSGFFHELVNPLVAISLHIDEWKQKEIKEALTILDFKRKREQLQFQFSAPGTFLFFGDNTQFFQIIITLLLHCIESYHGIPYRQKKPICIHLRKK